jgi:CRP-like cAMP-binding protein
MQNLAEKRVETVDIRQLLSNLPLFSKASDKLLDQFVAAAQVRTYDKGSVLFLQDDPASYFYVIVSGWVKLFRNTSEGDEAVIDMLSDNSMFGETAILEDNICTYGASVTDNAVLISLPVSLLKSSIETDSSLALSMLSALSKHRIRQTKELEGMTLKNASQRLGCFMLRLCNESDEENVILRLPYDKSLIAARLGMKSETFSRALNKLRAETDIHVSGSTVTVPWVEQLSDYACSACSNDFPCDDLRN